MNLSRLTLAILAMFMAVGNLAAQTVQVSATASYVYHPATGTVLVNQNGDKPMGPASLTKMMTLYLIFDALKTERINLKTEMPVSEKAWKMGGSKMFVEVGKTVPVESLIQGISVVSGNDACVVAAEYLGGTEEGFVKMMNDTAGKLGMTGTVFANSNGMPDPAMHTTARDMALLLTAIFRDFPEYKKYLAEEEFEWNGIKQQNRNGLLHADVGIDAGKTGHTEESGYHLASTAMQNGERLVVVVMGTSGFAEREGESLKAYRTFFASHKTHNLFTPGQPVAENVPVYQGVQGMVNLTVAEPIAIYASQAEADGIKAKANYTKLLQAPLATDKPVGELVVTLANGQTLTTALVPAQAVEQSGFAMRFLQTLGYKLGL